MLLTLVEPNMIASLALPAKISGRYSLRMLTVEGVNGNWLLKFNRRHLVMETPISPNGEVILQERNVYTLRESGTGRKMVLFADPETEDRKTYTRYVLPETFSLRIGRDSQNDICFRLPYVSSFHARLEGMDGRLYLTDLGSVNGTFVNNRRIQQKEILPGDSVYIGGLKLLFGKGFVALNNPDGMVYCSRLLTPLYPEYLPPEQEKEEDEYLEPIKFFYRSPRFKRDVETAQFTIDPPPQQQGKESTPMVLLLGPSITMGMVSLSTGFFTLFNVLNSGGSMLSAMPSLVMSVGMLMGTVLWPVVTKLVEKRTRRRKEEERRTKYQQYIAGMQAKIQEEGFRQAEILNENIVTLDDCIERIRNTRRTLWERMFRHNDFLMLRLGMGSLPLDAEFRFPERKFSVEEDPLQDELYRLCNSPHELASVPISLSLRDSHVMGVIGDRENVAAYVRGLVLQISALHSYDDVKMVFLYDGSESDQWDFAKWLPHTWNEQHNVHFMAGSHQDAREISILLERVFASRQEQEGEELLPWYVVFALDRKLGSQTELVRQILSEKECRGFSLVTAYDELRFLPKECTKVVELHGKDAYLYDQDDIYGQREYLYPDIMVSASCRDLSVQLGNTFLQAASRRELPDMLTFLEMFGVGKAEHLNALTRWQEHDPTRTLATEVGMDGDGNLFTLDLHEKFHGPHGLVAGMTGSGKSEFIMTYILSMAVNYHPNEVAFILIDYKGGGMAKAFERLPHTVGIITNLDGAAVNRSLVSIQSELKRRQAVFQKVSKQIGVSNIDIYKYQKLFREGKVEEPLQHLFIISDEFAELKTQQPDFMRELVSAARIGRSLGVHLILATQKPSGVVDDQIWSNSRFRICLKVQEKSDSMDMLKRPDAAELTQTGRFYLQVGYNEIFEMGQSAWGGAPYEPSDRPKKQKDRSVELLDNVGHVIRQAAIQEKRAGGAKQLDTIVGYLQTLAEEENIHARPLWKPPLKPVILLDELLKKYAVPAMRGLEPVIGEADDPENQRQFALTLPLSREGNAVVYAAAGGGKSTFISTMLYSLLRSHTARSLHLYLLDFGSETLRAFAKAPQVGDVLFSYDAEKVQNLFKMLTEELERRKRLCAEYGGDLDSYNSGSAQPMPYILTVIQNYAGFCEAYEELEPKVALLSREGTKYGILFVITAVNANAVRYRTLQNFRQLLVLQMNDNSEYSGILGSVGGVIPAHCKGRGLVKTDKVYEFQTASVSTGDVAAVIRTFAEVLDQHNKGAKAPRVPILPEHVTPDFVEGEIDVPNLLYPVGIRKDTLQTVLLNLPKRPIHFVLYQEMPAGFVPALAKVFTRREGLETVMMDSAGCGEIPGVRVLRDNDSWNQEAVRLFGELVYRHNNAKELLEKGEPAPVYSPLVCILNGVKGVFDGLTEDGKDKLHVMMEKSEVPLNVYFVVISAVSEVSSFSFRPWFKKQPVFQNAVWLGNGISDQFQLKVRSSGKLYESIGEEFGYLVEDGNAVLMKLLTTGEGAERNG